MEEVNVILEFPVQDDRGCIFLVDLIDVSVLVYERCHDDTWNGECEANIKNLWIGSGIVNSSAI